MGIEPDATHLSPADARSAPRAPNPARRNEQTRRAILVAAIELVGELGYEKVTVEAIAARARVGKQTIYRWWASKGAVLLDAFVEQRPAATDVDDDAGDGGEPPALDTGDFVADLRRVLRETVAEFATPSFEAPYRAVLIAAQHDPDLAADLAKRVIGPGFATVKEWLAAAQQRGQVRPDIDLDVALELMFGPIFHRWIMRIVPLTESYADELADSVARALAPPAT